MFNLTVNPDDGDSYELKITTRDAAQWEMKGEGRNITNAQEIGLRLVDVYELAFYAAVRVNKFRGNLEKFMSTNDLEFEDDEEDLDQDSMSQEAR